MSLHWLLCQSIEVSFVSAIHIGWNSCKQTIQVDKFNSVFLNTEVANTGIPCERFCMLSRLLRLSVFTSFVGEAFWEASEGISRNLNLGNQYGMG